MDIFLTYQRPSTVNSGFRESPSLYFAEVGLTTYDGLEELVEEFDRAAKDANLGSVVKDENSQIHNIVSDIRNKADSIRQDRFRLMVAGEAKSGKSTFINAYLRERLMPMNVLRCTSSIVEIKCGTRLKLVASYAGGEKKT